MTTNLPPKNCRSWDDVKDELFGIQGTASRQT